MLSPADRKRERYFEAAAIALVILAVLAIAYLPHADKAHKARTHGRAAPPGSK